ncbi:MAG: CDP-diacylglycerol--glycerol-3-phosphate 3-phosphatidyltransferase [Coprobacillus sp.]|nr:CDP-diacylglycerol--glycerol-3-phosphate 3-phosphatidyltransferase [Coprobacillus sp.]
MNTPTKLTFSRIIIIIAMVIALFVLSVIPDFVDPYIPGIKEGYGEIDLVFLVIFVVFIAACITDTIDGHMARKRDLITDLGKFLDPVADKLLIDSLLIFLISPSLFASYNTVQVISINVFIVIIFIARDIAVESLRFIAASKNVVIAANWWGKAKTVLEMVAIGFVLLNGWPFSYFDSGWPKGLHITDFIVYIAAAVSLISGIIYIVQNRQVFMKGDKHDEGNSGATPEESKEV